MRMYGIVGAGGFGREVAPLVLETLRDEVENGDAEVVFVVEGLLAPHTVNGIRVISTEQFIASGVEKSFNVAIGNGGVRKRISTILEASGATPFSIVAHNAMQLSTNEIGDGLVLCPFTTITSNARIGRFFHANLYSYVAHDCVIGDYVTFAPAVKCNGNVVVGDNVYIGTGAIIREGQPGNPTVIGEGAVIGMGAVVTRDVPAGSTVVGNPARKLESH